MTKKRKIVIYGGSFNPPHIGHATNVETILRLFKCDEIWVMPSANRTDKLNLAPSEHRFRMLKIMANELFPKSRLPIKISRMEIKRPKLTETLETYRELIREYPDAYFYFLLGSDLLSDIEEKWVNGKEIYNTLHFLIILKPGTPLPHKLPKHLTTLRNELIWPTLSSTLVRGLIKKGHTPLPYVTRKVADYIKKHRLYT